ncbi:MAG: MBL fold metallo-hydrolase [Bacteroidales bacterium]|nr:MBL fold metallo-hydrolase [Bacteroidales bacterium]
MLQVKIFQVNPLGENCIVLWEDAQEGKDVKSCAVVDPGFFRDDEEEQVLSFLRDKGLAPDAILLTHGHFDHTWGVASLVRRFGCPVYLSAADDPVLRFGSSLLDRLQLHKSVELFEYQDVADGQVIPAGGVSWQVITTPGHTPGCVCYYCEAAGVLLSGDTLFAGSIGRTDLDGGDYDALIKSVMDKVMGLPGETDVIPGHGHPTSIGREAATNPFLIPFNEPDTDWWNQDGIELDGI